MTLVLIGKGPDFRGLTFKHRGQLGLGVSFVKFVRNFTRLKPSKKRTFYISGTSSYVFFDVHVVHLLDGPIPVTPRFSSKTDSLSMSVLVLIVFLNVLYGCLVFCYKVGPLLVMNGYNPMALRGYNPYDWSYGPPFNIGRGTPCIKQRVVPASQ